MRIMHCYPELARPALLSIAPSPIEARSPAKPLYETGRPFNLGSWPPVARARQPLEPMALAKLWRYSRHAANRWALRSLHSS